ncbi:MAG TPA: membrane dipeptidase [Devosia sp.]|nr:membrane dipeptidase [Devosia sp.]
MNSIHSTGFPVFDGHNDTLLRLYTARESGIDLNFFQAQPDLHIDAVKALEGGFSGGFFAMFTPSAKRGRRLGFSLSTPEKGGAITTQRALEYTHAMIDVAEKLVKRSKGAAKICTSANDIRSALKANVMAMVLHIEGAEAIGEDFAFLDELYQRGLRSIGPVWSRDNQFAKGVPFTFPGLPDQGHGLSGLGKELVRICNAKGIVLDLSHLNEKGFRDIAKLSEHPLVATHSNAHALCPSPRNLTDSQLDAIAQSKGVVGLNFACGFLRKDGSHRNDDVPMQVLISHLDYLIEKLGEDGVALGSDFDGCTVPRQIGDCSGLPVLISAMQKAGYGSELIVKITSGNWISLLERTLKN